jgi:hypothetical protein
MYSSYTAGRLTARAWQNNGLTYTEMYSYTAPGQVTGKRLRVARAVAKDSSNPGLGTVTVSADLNGSWSYDGYGRVAGAVYGPARG